MTKVFGEFQPGFKCKNVSDWMALMTNFVQTATENTQSIEAEIRKSNG